MDRLHAVLERSRTLGFLGPGDLDAHLEHARGFVRAWDTCRDEPPGSVCDLGAGGGIPGLALALEWEAARIALVEAAARRCSFLRAAVEELGLGARAAVHEGRAEELARAAALEGSFALVVSRSFGPPATTAECAVRFLRPGGVLIVAEPPGDPSAPSALRWPADGLAELGLRLEGTVAGPSFVVLARVSETPARFPRRNGVPLKRPLF